MPNHHVWGCSAGNAQKDGAQRNRAGRASMTRLPRPRSSQDCIEHTRKEKSMREQIPIRHPKQRLLINDAEGFDALAGLALDMRSSWNHATDQVWRQLDPVLWELTQNPRVVLQTMSREKRMGVLADPAFRNNIDELVLARRDAA